VNATIRYRMPPPIPIPHHMISSLLVSGVNRPRLECGVRNDVVPHPIEMILP
jgi:hypothetical protein